MEGKLTYLRTLSPQETERVFNTIRFQRDQFITVDANNSTPLKQPGKQQGLGRSPMRKSVRALN